jgi:hypothetical protein
LGAETPDKCRARYQARGIHRFEERRRLCQLHVCGGESGALGHVALGRQIVEQPVQALQVIAHRSCHPLAASRRA